MANVLLIVFMFLLSSSVNAQAWHKQVIRNEVTISFPLKPEHKLIDNKGKEAYILHYEGCSFMAGIAPNVIEDYNSYVKASDSQRVATALRILEGVANGKLTSKDHHLISMESFRSGKNTGLDIAYTTLQPSDPKSRKRYSTLLLVKNTLYIFDCWYLDQVNHDKEKDKFFSSILLKE